MLFEKCCSLLDECLYRFFISISWVYDGIHLKTSIVSAYGFFYCLSCSYVEWKRISPQLPLKSGTIFHYCRLLRELELYFMVPYIAAYECYFFWGSHSQRLPITICLAFLSGFYYPKNLLYRRCYASTSIIRSWQGWIRFDSPLFLISVSWST